ncbi:MAG: hypothetical protein Q7S40_16520 [Opitutaceae bacterium]|nr:hypothetical protein [Opitutaceae bacterium]
MNTSVFTGFSATLDAGRTKLGVSNEQEPERVLRRDERIRFANHPLAGLFAFFVGTMTPHAGFRSLIQPNFRQWQIHWQILWQIFVVRSRAHLIETLGCESLNVAADIKHPLGSLVPAPVSLALGRNGGSHAAKSFTSLRQ